MTSSNKPTAPFQQQEASLKTQGHGIDWKARHCQALRCPETRFEQAFVQMLRGWEGYAVAHQSAYASAIHDDGVLGESWSQVGEGLLGLLNGQLDRLDGGHLDCTIRDLLTPTVEEDRDFDSGSTSSTSLEAEKSEADRLVFAYSRAEAIADGVLVDVSETAKQAGFRISVALTRSLWADIQAIPERLQGVADMAGRLWDVLFVGRYALSQQPETACCHYRLEMPVAEARLYEVKAHVGPGDKGERVLTLMQPGED